MGNFIVYNASAGSGKTFTLVSEYLSLCLGQKGESFKSDSFRNILAITFTNKATQELENRVIETLQELATNAAESPYSEGISKSTGLEVKDIQYRAGFVLEKMLHNFTQLSIKTIDKFTTQLVKPFSLDLGLPPEYKILLSNELHDVREKIVKRIISKAGKDQELSEILLSWTDRQIDLEQKPLSLERSLVSFAEILFDEKNIYVVDALKNSSKGKDIKQKLNLLRPRINDLDKDLKKRSEEISKLLEKIGHENIQHKNGSGLKGQLDSWSSAEFKTIKPNSRLAKMIQDPNGPVHKDALDQFQQESLELQKLLIDTNEFCRDKSLERIFIQQIISNLPFLQISEILKKEYDRYCAENAAVPLGELSIRIREILENQGTEFIYERLGNRYQHILIDEFQDTSVLQWQNLFPIVSNILSDGGKCILVGDAKQAIYRFRGGEVEQIVHLPKIQPNPNPAENLGIEQQFVSAFEPKNLETNYRSGDNIVAFNNNFLSYTAETLDEAFAKFYKAGKQKTKPNNLEGFVRVVYGEEDKIKEHQEAGVNFAIKQVKEALENGVKASDIAILTRNAKSINLISDALQEENIGTSSARGISFLSYAPIKLIYHILDLGQHLQTEVKGSKVLNSLSELDPEKYPTLKGYREYFELRGKYNCQLDKEKLLNFCGYYPELRSGKISIAIESICKALDIDITMHPMQLLLNLARNYQYEQGTWHSGFVDFLKEECNQLTLNPEALNAVVLTTYHSCKGLDFHTVILPYIDSGKDFPNSVWMPTPRDLDFSQDFPIAWISLNKNNAASSEDINEVKLAEEKKDYQDDVNLAYVAHTRAVANLVIFAPFGKKSTSKENSIEYSLIQFLKQHYPAKEKGIFEMGTWHSSEEREQESSLKEIRLDSIQSENPVDKKLLYPKEIEATERGKALHLWFANYDYQISKEDFIAKIFAKDPNAEEKEVQRFYEKLNQRFSEVLGTKPEKTLVEREFCFGNEILRPDRIDFYPNEVIVSDLKTGLENEAHHKQIKTYLSCVESVFGIKAKAFLLYVDMDKTTEVYAN